MENKSPFELTAVQQFELERIRRDALKAPKDKLEEIVVDLARQLFIKNNLLVANFKKEFK